MKLQFWARYVHYNFLILHRPPANPTSQKVNNVEEKTLANTEPQTPPLRMVKINSQNLILQRRSPPIFPKP